MTRADTINRLIVQLRGETQEGRPEQHFVVNRAGEVVSHLVGDTNMVLTGGIPAALLAGAVTLHQHPGTLNWPPSEDDLVNALAVGEAQTIIVTSVGIHRLTGRHPKPAEHDRFAALLEAAQIIETRAARRLGWYGSKEAVPRRLKSRFPEALAAELRALAEAYPEFITYRFEPWT